jgi:hypothetical protein
MSAKTIYAKTVPLDVNFLISPHKISHIRTKTTFAFLKTSFAKERTPSLKMINLIAILPYLQVLLSKMEEQQAKYHKNLMPALFRFIFAPFA